MSTNLEGENRARSWVGLSVPTAVLVGERPAGRTGALDGYPDLIGRSTAMRELFAVLGRVEHSLANVLIEGESGTGKELIARAIHQNSRVASGRFVAVNCAAMDRALARSELFGHKRGAFTGALEARVGAFETAAGGTLFLDEVSELPQDVQPVLLRALESRSIVRLGETQERPAQVRIVAATNRNLSDETAAGRFREDLYFRLVTVQVDVPPLRARSSDIELLARHFARHVGLDVLPQYLMEELQARCWTGNVRELRSAIEAFAVLGRLPIPQPSSEAALEQALKRQVDLERPYAEQKTAVLTAFRRVYVNALLCRANGNRSAAARASGIERSYLNKLTIHLRDE